MLRRAPQLLGPLLLLAITAVAVWHALWFWPEVIDDAYITLRYARNAVQGNGLAFNPGGHPVEGFSNPTWTLLAGLLLRSGAADVLWATKLAGLLLHAATVPLVWLLTGGPEVRRSWAAWVAPLAFACNPFSAYHAVAGLETPLYTGLLAAAGAALLRADAAPRAAGVLGGLALALLVATRPEGFGYAGVLIVVAIWRHRADRQATGAVLSAGALAVAAFGALSLWRFATFGQWLPNTVVAKSAGPSSGDVPWRGVPYALLYFMSDRLPLDAITVLLAAFVLLRRGGAWDAQLAATVGAAIAFCVAARGDWMHSFRFMAPVTPWVAALLGRAAVRVAQDARAVPRVPPALLRVVAAPLLLGALALQSTIALVNVGTRIDARTRKPGFWPLRVPERVAQPFPARLAGVTHWALDHVAPGQVLATGDIGFPAWATDVEIVDLVGLTDSTLARIVPANDARAYGAYVSRRKPDWIVLRLDDGLAPTRYDALTLQSGVLGAYALVDSTATYGEGAVARLYRRSDGARAPSRREVLARYDMATHWNPRVAELRMWRDAFAALPPARSVEPAAAPADSIGEAAIGSLASPPSAAGD